MAPVDEGARTIATRLSTGHEPIQIRADILRDWKASTAYCARQGLAVVPDHSAAHSGQDEMQRPSGWRDADLKRAIQVAEEAGLRSYHIEIATDGALSIIVNGYGARPK